MRWKNPTHAKVSPGLEKETGKAPHLFALSIFVIHVPNVAHGRIAVVDVTRARGRDYTLCGPGFDTYDHVIAAQIELLKRERAEREQMPVKPAVAWKILQKRCDHPIRGKASENLLVPH